jgi:hypothetical protein
MPARLRLLVAGMLIWSVAANGPTFGASAHPPVLDACGDCHMVFPPQMLPKASWITILGGLDDHFGEAATLPAEQVRAIRDYLTAHAADSPNATIRDRHYLAALPLGAAPLRITATPWWNQMHADFDFAGVKRSSVKSLANCPACHKEGFD